MISFIDSVFFVVWFLNNPHFRFAHFATLSLGGPNVASSYCTSILLNPFLHAIYTTKLLTYVWSEPRYHASHRLINFTEKNAPLFLIHCASTTLACDIALQCLVTFLSMFGARMCFWKSYIKSNNVSCLIVCDLQCRFAVCVLRVCLK